MFRFLSGRNIFSHLMAFLAYYLGVSVIHLLLVSAAAFFHFLLDHKINDIESWVFDNGWWLVLIAKTGSCVFIMKYIHLTHGTSNPLRKIIRQGFRSLPKELYVVLVYLYFMFLWAYAPSSAEGGVDLLDVVLAFIGIFVFYISDAILLMFVQEYYDIKPRQKLILLSILPFIFYYFSNLAFPYAKEIGLLACASFMMMNFLGQWGGRNWSLPAAYIFLFFAPVLILIGHDPIWGSHHSLLNATKEVPIIDIVAIYSIAVFYFVYKQRNNTVLKGRFSWKAQI